MSKCLIGDSSTSRVNTTVESTSDVGNPRDFIASEYKELHHTLEHLPEFWWYSPRDVHGHLQVRPDCSLNCGVYWNRVKVP